MTELHVLSLGAGVQSTALYLMSMEGRLPKLDAAIFADTQEEPKAVYQHLDWLRSLGGPPILTGTAGNLGDDLRSGRNSTGGRFAAIPAFTTKDGGENVGQTRRQCSKEYKTEVIGKVLRREILGLQPGRPPKGVKVHQYIGISADEAGRATRMQRNVPAPKYIQREFPFVDQFATRGELKTWLAPRVPHETPRSACVFCPYHDDAEWQRIKEQPDEWARACEIDRGLRGEYVANRDMDQTMYLHRSCKPLELVQLKPQPKSNQTAMNFWAECEGMCGV